MGVKVGLLDSKSRSLPQKVQKTKKRLQGRLRVDWMVGGGRISSPPPVTGGRPNLHATIERMGGREPRQNGRYFRMGGKRKGGDHTLHVT